MSPFLILPGSVANRSQIDSPLPSKCAAPSICAAAVATPQTKPFGKLVARHELRSSLAGGEMPTELCPDSGRDLGRLIIHTNSLAE